MNDGPPPGGHALRVCAGADLVDGGRARLWDVRVHGQPARAFVLRHAGVPRAYVNRCVHVPTEMDWLPGEFLDAERRFIVCTLHGASYDPADGRCVGGPCRGGRLTALAVVERADGVYWYPSRDIHPAPTASSGTAADESLR